MEKPSHKIAISVAATLIATAILRFTTSFTFAGAFRWLESAFNGCRNFLGGSLEVWMWLLIVLVMLSVAFISLIAVWIHRSLGQPSSAAYKKDSFDGLVWRWDYNYSGGISSPWCYCPQCDGVLAYSVRDIARFDEMRCRWATNFHCDHCDRTVAELFGDLDSIVHRTQRLIDRKIRVGEWREVVAQHPQKASPAE